MIKESPSMRPEWRKAAGLWPVDLAQGPNLRKSFDVLRKKWGEVPFEQYGRKKSADLLRLSDSEVMEQWDMCHQGASTGKALSVRGWYQTIYRDVFRCRRLLDVGCGLAPDTVHYAEHGARVTFLDVVESNVGFVER